MDIHLPDNLLRRIQAHAEEAYPDECCGLLLGETTADGGRTIREVEALSNPAAEEGASDRYRIDSADYLRIDRRARAGGWEILGSYHSHPDDEAAPSAVDLACAWPWYAYLIVSVQDGRAVDWRCWVLEEAAGRPPRFRSIALCAGSV